jgi:hypothetical protein
MTFTSHVRNTRVRPKYSGAQAQRQGSDGVWPQAEMQIRVEQTPFIVWRQLEVHRIR